MSCRILTVCLNPTFQKTLVFPKYSPDRVNRIAQTRFDVSGKGINVSRVLAQLGKESINLTQMGGDLRSFFLSLCWEEGLDIRWVESGSPIRFAYTIIDLKKNHVTELVEEAEEVDTQTEKRILNVYKKILPGMEWVVISGSKAKGFSDEIFPEMVYLAKTQNISVILDIRGTDLLNCLPHKPYLIKPNLEEFTTTFVPKKNTGKKLIDKNEAEELCLELWKKYRCSVVLTRGSLNIWYAEKGKLNEIPVLAVKPVNTTGSGDAFTAGLCAALADGLSLKKALFEAECCGRLNSLMYKPGTIVQQPF